MRSLWVVAVLAGGCNVDLDYDHASVELEVVSPQAAGGGAQPVAANGPFMMIAGANSKDGGATWGTNKQRAVIEADGRRARSSTTEEASKGVPMGDVWEIGVIAPVSKERTGYPSQKPEALLSRLIESLSDPGDIVLDPYMGSGTTVAVAAKLGRSFLGCDASDVAFGIAEKRLRALGVEMSDGLPDERAKKSA